MTGEERQRVELLAKGLWIGWAPDMESAVKTCLAERDAAMAALRGVVREARTAHEYWDKDQDSKVGKHLAAMSGYLKNYCDDATAIHAALAMDTEGESCRKSS